MMVVYTQKGCTKCMVLKKKLEDYNFQYVESEDIDILINNGFSSTPVLEVDGHMMDFSEAIQWINSYKGE